MARNRAVERPLNFPGGEYEIYFDRRVTRHNGAYRVGTFTIPKGVLHKKYSRKRFSLAPNISVHRRTVISDRGGRECISLQAGGEYGPCILIPAMYIKQINRVASIVL
jgi:hypothetical protein